jgi:hypothetical protein
MKFLIGGRNEPGTDRREAVLSLGERIPRGRRILAAHIRAIRAIRKISSPRRPAIPAATPRAPAPR